MIGGGLLGLEAAHGLTAARHEGHRRPPDGRPDGAPARRRGRLPAQDRARSAAAQTILPGADQGDPRHDQVEGVRLKDGTDPAPTSWSWRSASARDTLARDGRPRRSSAASSSTTTWCTSDPAILAVGECVEHDGHGYGLVAPLWEMCRALADDAGRTAERPIAARSPRPSSRSRHRRLLRRRFRRRRRTARTSSCATPRAASTSGGAQGRPASSARCSTAIPPTATGTSTCCSAGEDIADIRDTLIFGQAFAGRRRRGP